MNLALAQDSELTQTVAGSGRGITNVVHKTLHYGLHATGTLFYGQSAVEKLKQGDIFGALLDLAEAGASHYRFMQACFAAGTPLLTPQGSKPIEELRPGDLILSRDEHNVEGPVEAKVVEEVFVRTGRILHLHVGGQLIRTTPEHPFFVYDKGWLPAGQLETGDVLSSHDGQRLTVEEVFDTGEYETVYNCRVADFHTYFVGSSAEWGFSVWAHNLSCQEIDNLAVAFAKEAQANGGSVPRGVWKRIAGNQKLSEGNKSAIRKVILDDQAKGGNRFPNVNIKPRGKDGPLGSPAVRTLDHDIAHHLKSKGWTPENGPLSGRKQEWISGEGKYRTGGKAVDVTVSRTVDGKKQWVRVQTVDTLADGKTPDLREARNADRIRAKFPNDRLILVPKGSAESVWQALLAAL